MPGSLEKLLLNAGPSLVDEIPFISEQLYDTAGTLANPLLSMLRQRNGFYALESALHVFPSHSKLQVIGLDKWNDQALWRGEFEGMADDCLFFAEDVFGGQFCIKDCKVHTFDPETGKLDYLADDIDMWASAIIDDYEILTGFSLAHAWQKQHGELTINTRLLPKIPFVMGGEFALNNLYLSDAVVGMKLRADMAKQIKNLPEGAKIKLEVNE